MTDTLLNDNQQRRLGTHLRLLTADLEALAECPELARPGDPYDRLRGLVSAARGATDEVREALHLPTERGPSVKRRIAAVAEVWAVRLADLRARRLSGYGPVHPDLARQLDPRIEDVRRTLLDLADAAARLPED